MPFSTTTLNDNWFEDRMQPEGALAGSGPVHLKKARKYETEIAYIGDRYDVLSRIARVPGKVSFAVPDDGFNEKHTLNKLDFVNPRSRTAWVAKPPLKPTFINQETVSEVCHEERRPLQGQQRGFGAVLDRHQASEGQRCWNTATGDVFGEPPAGAVGTRRARLLGTKSEPSLVPHHSGRSSEMEENKISGMKCGKLCGEDYRVSKDPAMDTKIQRAWMYAPDVAVSNAHLGGCRPLPPKIDNHLSVPLGEGAQKKIRTDLANRRGMLYRTATYVTKGTGARAGISIFQDHAGEVFD